jgi:hypothetical protein
MAKGRAVVVEIKRRYDAVWQITLEITLPPGSQRFEPDLNSLGEDPRQLDEIRFIDAPQRVAFTVVGRPWVRVGDLVAMEVAP